MYELDLSKRSQIDYQTVLRTFDRLPSGESLTILTRRNPDWLIELVEDLRPLNLAGYEYTEEGHRPYAVKLRKVRYPVGDNPQFARKTSNR